MRHDDDDHGDDDDDLQTTLLTSGALGYHQNRRNIRTTNDVEQMDVHETPACNRSEVV